MTGESGSQLIGYYNPGSVTTYSNNHPGYAIWSFSDVNVNLTNSELFFVDVVLANAITIESGIDVIAWQNVSTKIDYRHDLGMTRFEPQDFLDMMDRVVAAPADYNTVFYELVRNIVLHGC